MIWWFSVTKKWACWKQIIWWMFERFWKCWGRNLNSRVAEWCMWPRF